MATPIPESVLLIVRAHYNRLREIEPRHQAELLRISQKLEKDVEARLGELDPTRFTAQQQRAVLLQLRATVATYSEDLEGALVDMGEVSAAIGRDKLVTELAAWESEFRGTLERIAPIEEAAELLDPGLLEYYAASADRYGLEQIAQFRGVMAESMLAGETLIQTTEKLVTASGLPDWRAERIVRTETSLAYHRRQQLDLEETFGDEAEEWDKELVTTFDRRTGEDSKFVHGQTRKLKELFKDNEGREYLHPPNRPNDRETEVMVPPEGAFRVPRTARRA